MHRVPHLFLALVGLLAAAGALTTTRATAEEEPPAGVEQLLPRGRIAAVLDPQFVTATEAEVPDEAWVLGVVIDGVAKAYSLNLLNRHEVVNDRTGETAYAAVW